MSVNGSGLRRDVRNGRGLRVLIACGMTDKKLRQKLQPIVASPVVEEILLVRRRPYAGEKIRCYAVPRVLRRSLLMAECWRLLATLYLCVLRRPDVAVCMTLLLHGLHTYAAHVLFDVPLVHHLMGKVDLQLHRPRPPWLRRLMWWFSLRADVLVVRGGPTRQRFIGSGRVPPERVFVQHNVFDMTAYTPDAAVPKRYDVAYVGYLAAYKRVDLLIEVVAKLRSRRDTVNLAIAGEGDQRRYMERLAAELKVRDCITFLGTCDEDRLIQVLRSSRVFAMTSLGEGLPQAMIEAMACGLPCVLFDDADMREIVRPGDNGILVPPGDIETFADQVDRLLSDREHYQRIAASAARIHEEYGRLFAVEAQAEIWTAAIRAAREASLFRSRGQ
ncbi:glycosyltransferase family 4 protein [Planctomycetota bacterium]